MPRCDECRFFHPHPPADRPGQIVVTGNEVLGGGECRRRPPTCMQRDHSSVFPLACFPLVAVECWCGEFEDRESRCSDV